MTATAGLAEVLRDWRPGTVEITRRVEPWPLRAFARLVDGPEPGDVLPPLWHWFVLLDDPPARADTGEDGHPATGPFLPPIPGRRRMFAGGRLELDAPIPVGATLTGRSAVSGMEVKAGRTGEMAFVTVRTELSVDGAGVGAEEQDVVYRSEPPGTPRRTMERARATGAEPGGDWRLELPTDPVLLYRTSALIANGHRIHYDHPYATGVEGYPGLVVHGPLLAFLGLELPRRHAPDRAVRRFAYRLIRPAFVPDPLAALAHVTATGADVTVGAGRRAVPDRHRRMGEPVLTSEERAVVEVVREFVDRDVRPVVREMEHANTYPEKQIEQMKELGVYGLAIPEPWGEVAVSMPCYALVTAELARGWMSLAGAMGGHTVVAKLLVAFGTPEQQERWLPRMATGEVRATMALTEPGGGSDLQAMTTVARPDGDGWVIDGAKTWISNARRSGLIALLCKTDPHAEPRHSGVSVLLVEHGPGLTVSKDLAKLGYKGVEACELVFDGYRAPAGSVLGDAPGRGFAQMMKGLETGRIQVAARALGVAQAAFDDALRYSQERESFGKPIWQHQSVGNYLADMATKITAARQLILHAAEKFDAGERCDLEAGMAKLFASEMAMEVALDAVRIHGGYGYSTEYDVERYFRDAPLMIVGEGTNEIQRNVIAAQLVKRGGL